MRFIALIFTIFLLLTTNVTAISKQTDSLTTLAGVTADIGLQADSWQVVVKEKMNREQLRGYIKKLQSKNDYISSSKADENSIKYLFEHRQNQTDITEHYQVVIPKNTAYKAEFIAVFSGDVWNNKTEKAYHSRIAHMKDTYFSKHAKTFACLTTTIDGKMDGVYFLDKLTETMNVKVSQTQKDTVETSQFEKIVYGHTPMLNEELMINNESMNVQMVLKNKGPDRTTLTIGTPILITEY
ncbi:YwmB family TATA-box binding protein [Lentibacillus cibarius]|uniref:TATA-box binding n=1 Tax=Lentibacillus cibarius TaxID=2583219 RepID=A0A5S3QJS7_9BACI|nr:YwmB family TATA-box binding protein [Lentibacillus cibarius]TMN21989.1 hypothetical protein FFL34_07560 [Lentibacillus cibarius]